MISSSKAGLAIGLYALLWGGAVAYLYAHGADWTTPLFVLGIFGIAVSAIAWLVTRGADAPPIPVARPAIESIAVLIYLALYAVLFLGPGMSWARHALPPGREQELLVLGLKLLVHVVGPALLLTLLGARIAPLFRSVLHGTRFWLAFIVLGAVLLALQCIISPSLQNIEAAQIPVATLAWAAPLSFIWITIEAGLCEEFLFRAVLQTRLTAWFKSPWLGGVMMAILFGLAHAPGLFLRGNAEVDGWSTDPIQVAAYTIATLSPLGLAFGVIYARTKSLLLVVLLHGIVDVLPNMPDFIRIWA